MTDPPQDDHRRGRHELETKISSKRSRKLRARRQGDRTVWFGLGMFGLVGWSVAVPALIGVAAGLWIDARWPSRFSWTLMLLVAGVIVGCFNAWRWVERESREANEDERKGGE